MTLKKHTLALSDVAITQPMIAKITSSRGALDGQGHPEALSTLTSVIGVDHRVVVSFPQKGEVQITLPDALTLDDITLDTATAQTVTTAALNVTGDADITGTVSSAHLSVSGTSDLAELSVNTVTAQAVDVTGAVSADYVTTNYVVLTPYPVNAIPSNLPPYALFAITAAA